MFKWIDLKKHVYINVHPKMKSKINDDIWIFTLKKACLMMFTLFIFCYIILMIRFIDRFIDTFLNCILKNVI